MKINNPVDRTCCKLPIMNPEIPPFECTKEIALSNSVMKDWYVSPATYEQYKLEARLATSKKFNVKTWDANSCVQNGQQHGIPK
jgi:hypothetical protein